MVLIIAITIIVAMADIRDKKLRVKHLICIIVIHALYMYVGISGLSLVG